MSHMDLRHFKSYKEMRNQGSIDQWKEVLKLRISPGTRKTQSDLVQGVFSVPQNARNGAELLPGTGKPRGSASPRSPHKYRENENFLKEGQTEIKRDIGDWPVTNCVTSLGLGLGDKKGHYS